MELGHVGIVCALELVIYAVRLPHKAQSHRHQDDPDLEVEGEERCRLGREMIGVHHQIEARLFNHIGIGILVMATGRNVGIANSIIYRVKRSRDHVIRARGTRWSVFHG